MNLLDPTEPLRCQSPARSTCDCCVREGGPNLLDMPEPDLYTRACRHGWGFACEQASRHRDEAASGALSSLAALSLVASVAGARATHAGRAIDALPTSSKSRPARSPWARFRLAIPGVRQRALVGRGRRGTVGRAHVLHRPPRSNGGRVRGVRRARHLDGRSRERWRDRSTHPVAFVRGRKRSPTAAGWKRRSKHCAVDAAADEERCWPKAGA